MQSVNSELETTKQKIQEISSIGVPTLVEQNELNKLSTSNAQLEIQRTLLENNIKLKQKSTALDAKELLETQVEMEYADILDGSSIESHNESYSYKDHAKYQAFNLRNAYNIYMKALREGDVKKQQLAQELIAASAGDSATLTSELLEIIELFKYEDGTVIEGYEKIYNEYMGLIYNLQSLTNPDTFLVIAKSVTSNTGIDYEKVISDVYKLAFEGDFDIDKLNQDFVKALSNAGIDESTIDYIFSVKQQEYQLLVDKINEKYKVSETPDKIKQYYWDANGNIHSEYIDVDEETKKQIAEINTVNERLSEYAKESPIKFQLVSSFDENFETLDNYIEEERIKAENATDYVGDYITNAIERICDEAKVQSSTLNFENPISLFNQLSKSEESLDKFQASIKSAAEAYTTLLTGNYSSNDLLDSIQAINQAASDMKGTIDWEEIESLDELGDKIEEISQTYANSVLSGAGIDIDNDFRQMLANIIQEAYESEAALASLNTQIDSLQDSYKNLTDIIETYNQHSYVTFDQLQTLLSMEPQYLSCLIDENGQLRLNREAMQELAKQRLKDARAQIIAQAITELNELQFKKEKTAIDDAKMAIEDIDDTLTSYEERLLEFIPIGELTTEEFIKISNAINGAASNGVSDEDIDAALQNAEKKLKFLKDMWNGEIGSMFGGFASSEKASDTEKEFDWIEQAIENVRKEIQSLDEIANSSYATFSQKNAALAKEIEKVSEEIALQQKAYEEYMRKADSTGLADHYKTLAQNGSASIEDISDEKLLEQIDTYRQWYDKAQSAADAIKELNTDLKDLHVSAYELHTEDLKDRLDNGSLTEKQYLSELKAAYERFYGNLEEYAQQYHEAVLDCLKQEKEYLNTVAGAAVSLLDTEIDAVRDSADEQEEQLKKQIELLEEKKKPLQEELDALEEKARKEDLILNLQKAQYDLARAENQRTKLVYKDGQLVYTNDSKAARDAQKGLDDAKLEIQKQSIQDRLDGLDEEISRYNDLIDQINKAADTQIKALEKIKDKWQEITHQQEYAKNITILTGEFGADAIERLLSGGLLEQWKNSYISILSAIDMETQGYIGEMTKQLAELYKGTFDETGARIAVPSASPSREESGNPPSGAAMISGDSVLTPLQPGDEMYGMMQKWNAYMDSINGNVEKLIPYSVNDHNRQMSEAARRISNVSNVVNNRNVQPVVNGGINITCPGITSQEVARQVGAELNKMFNGLHLEAEQRSRMR